MSLTEVQRFQTPTVHHFAENVNTLTQQVSVLKASIVLAVSATRIMKATPARDTFHVT